MTKKKKSPTQSATTAEGSSPKPNTISPVAATAEAPKQPSSTGTQQQLSDAEKQQIAALANLLGIPQIVEQITKLTEAVNSIMTSSGTKGGVVTISPAAAVASNMPPWAQGLIQTVGSKIPDIINAITGSGGGGQSPMEKEILDAVKNDYADLVKNTNEAVKLMVQEIRSGKTIMRNQETGDIVITRKESKVSNNT